MVSFDKISTLDYIQSHLNDSDKRFFVRNGIFDYQKLEDFIIENPGWEFSKTGEHLKKVKERYLASDQEVERTIYTIPTYTDSTLSFTDELVKGDSLLVYNPTSATRCMADNLGRISVSEIKHRLTHLNVYLRNLMEVYQNMSPARAKVVQRAIYLYNEQIERQALETNERDINLFTYMYDERKEMVREQIDEVIEWFLVNNIEETIWCKMSDNQKRKFANAINGKLKVDVELREELVNIIAKYVSVSEAIGDLAEGDTLKRFVLK